MEKDNSISKENVTSTFIIDKQNPNLLCWEKTLPLGQTKRGHYNSLCKAIDYCLEKCSSDVSISIPSEIVPVFAFIESFKYSETYNVNGAYLLGYLHEDIPVYVVPEAAGPISLKLLSTEACFNIFITEKKEG